MIKGKSYLKPIATFFTTPRMKRAYWNAANGFVSVLTIQVGELNVWYVPVIFAVLNGITRELNKKTQQ